jgi:hypothetical protein
MKKLFTFSILLILFGKCAIAQYSASFQVNGDANKYYPVIFQDLNFLSNKATEFEIGRSLVHTDGDWRGSFISKFRIHTFNWGHGSSFIDADIRQFSPFSGPFIGGWTDVTAANGDQAVIIWLKGGTTTYYWNAAVNISPVVYDGVQHGLPYQEFNGPARTYKTAVDPYVNSYGMNGGDAAYYTGSTNNYFAGKVGIGTPLPDDQLTVNGRIHSREVKVDVNIPVPDYVFHPDYKLPKLEEVRAYVNKNHHLIGVPSAKEIEKQGLGLGEMNLRLLKKIEELTLYVLRQDRSIEKGRLQNARQQAELSLLKKQVQTLSKQKASTN